MTTVCLMAAFDPNGTGMAQTIDAATTTTRSAAPGIYVLEAFGRNVGVAVGPDGALVVDSNFRELAEKTKEAVRRLTDRPIRFVVNTHAHRDHIGGNHLLMEPGTVSIGHENIRRLPLRGAPPPTLGVFEALMLHMNGDDVHVFHAPGAHTDRDLVIHFQKANVIFLGDLYFNPMYPAIVGGSTEGLISALTRIIEMIAGNTVVVPGHGPLSSRTEVIAYRDMLRDVRTKIAGQVEQGKSRPEVIAAKSTAAHDERWGRGAVLFERSSLAHDGDWFAGVVYDDLKRQLASYLPTIEVRKAVEFVESGARVSLEAEATAYGDAKVDSVQFLVNGRVAGVDREAPYTLMWTPEAGGRHVVTASVHDSWGRVAVSAPVTVFVGVRALERQVTQAGDDAEELPGGGMYLTSSDLELIEDPDRGQQVVGLRFTDLRIPRGAQISKAYLQFTADQGSSGHAELTIQAELADDARPFGEAARDISSRARTRTSVRWSPEQWAINAEAAEQQRTPDLSALVAEVVALPGWREGNALSFVISGSGRRRAVSYEGNPRQAPILCIELAQR